MKVPPEPTSESEMRRLSEQSGLKWDGRLWHAADCYVAGLRGDYACCGECLEKE